MLKFKFVLIAVTLGLLSTPVLAAGQGGKGLFKKYDADKDGKVSSEEYTDARTRHFEWVDADKDGSLSQDEVQDLKNKTSPEGGKVPGWRRFHLQKCWT